MLFRRKDKGPHVCSICGRPEAPVRIKDGYLCSYCAPITSGFADPTVEEIRERQIADPEIRDRIDAFKESSSFADLRFDDDHNLFFKGPWPSYSIPILAYEEIAGYRILINGEPTAFNSTDGRRALFKTCTDDYIRSVCKTVDSIVLELDSSRTNIRFAPYKIWSSFSGVLDSKQDSLKMAIDVSRKLDSIVENNLICKNKNNIAD